MGKVSYTFDCGWNKLTLSQGDILWAKEFQKRSWIKEEKEDKGEWTPYKIKIILIDYTYGDENTHAIFRCTEVRKSEDHPYYITNADEDLNFISRYINEDEIGLSVFTRNPDEPVEEYYKRTGK